MKAASFDYAAPERLDEALALLNEYDEDAKVLAGGQSLVPLLALRMARFEVLVDINRLDALKGIHVTDGDLFIGAGTRQADIAASELVREHAPLLAAATHYIGHFQIRNRGTIGGSIAHADPTAEYPAAALALDAEVEVADWRGRRRISIDELIDSAYVTTLEPDELLLSVHIPAQPPRTGHGIEEIARRPGDFALVGGVANLTLDANDTIERARVVLFGVADRATRMTVLEDELVGARASDLGRFEAVCARIAADLKPPSDVQATATYRREVAGPLMNRLISRAVEQAHGERESSER